MTRIQIMYIRISVCVCVCCFIECVHRGVVTISCAYSHRNAHVCPIDNKIMAHARSLANGNHHKYWTAVFGYNVVFCYRFDAADSTAKLIPTL